VSGAGGDVVEVVDEYIYRTGYHERHRPLSSLRLRFRRLVWPVRASPKGLREGRKRLLAMISARRGTR
jgi:hypothetical protein